MNQAANGRDCTARNAQSGLCHIARRAFAQGREEDLSTIG